MKQKSKPNHTFNPDALREELKEQKQQRRAKKKSFVQGMATGKAARAERRETFLKKIVEEKMTRYAKEEFQEIWALSPYAWVRGLTYRIGHLSRAMGSIRRAIILCFAVDKIVFAYNNNRDCHGEKLFYEGRQWAYLSIQTLMRTGLFSGRKDAQDTMDKLQEMGLLYKREPRRESNKSHATTWYSIEFFHPVFIFWPDELFKRTLEDLMKKANNLLRNKEARVDRIEEIKAAFEGKKLIPEDEFQQLKKLTVQTGKPLDRTDSKGKQKTQKSAQ